MKKFNGKAYMVITLFLASLVATPVMVAGSTYDNDFNLDQFDNPGDLIGGFGKGFGNIFRGLGYGGELLAAVFDMLLMQTLTNFSGKETLPGVYVLSAFQEKTVSHVPRDYSGGEEEIYLLPYEYLGVSAAVYNPNTYGYPYCVVTQSGTYEFNITTGVGVTLVIWDQDNSFVNAVKKIISFFNKIFSYIERGALDEITEDLIREGIELITWFLIHINDIFTGDELFVLNPITWQKLEIKTDDTFSVTKEWFVTGPDWNIDSGMDMPIAGSAVDSTLFMWNETAKARKDSYMQWLLTETDDVSLLEDIYTSFSFDLIQLWIKNFEIHINVAAALDLLTNGGGTVDVTEIFQGLDIEFYLFTHHLAGAFLYNDTNDDNKLSANYVQVNQTGTNIPVLVDGKPVEVPIASELTHRLILGTVDNFQYNLPLEEGGKIKWGLKLNQPTITPVPVGIDLDSYLGASNESLDYIDFGFSFEPKTIELATEDGGTVPVLHGAVKVVQNFAPWNEITNPPYGAINDIHGLDLAIIYVSTILHFHLNIATLGEDPEEKLDRFNDYDNITHTIKIGNYLPENIKDKLEFVDIAGPDYFYGAKGTTDSAPATTNTLPLSFFKTEREKHETFEGVPSEVEPFAADIGLNVSFSVMIYAICFSEFDDGTGIWHDPTFSVYMVFEAKGFWAIILLVAGVGLVGVATILIKRRKDARF